MDHEPKVEGIYIVYTSKTQNEIFKSIRWEIKINIFFLGQ